MMPHQALRPQTIYAYTHLWEPDPFQRINRNFCRPSTITAKAGTTHIQKIPLTLGAGVVSNGIYSVKNGGNI